MLSALGESAMVETRTMRRLVSVLNWSALSILLSIIYPVVFALSNNWFTIGSQKILWLIGSAVGIAAAIAASAWFLDALIVRVILRTAPDLEHRWKALIAPAIVALLCAGILAALFWGTLQAVFGSDALTVAAAGSAAVAIVWVFVSGRVRYFNGILALLTALSTVGWLFSYADHKLLAPMATKFLAEKETFESARLVEKPNIYVFIFDAYGSRDAYQRVFNFDNSAHYDALGNRGFKVLHTFSNYYATWPTTLSLFLGNHHYYRISTGMADSKIGRLIMAGLARNPVLETLRNNGYRVQQIHGIDYFLNERGVLDFVYPEEPLYSALRIFDSPLLNGIFGAHGVRAGPRSVKEEMKVLWDRMRGPPADTGESWFTFSHVSLPNHAPIGADWLQLKDFEQQFRDATVTANKLMLEVIDAIKAKDPGAIVVIIGDHGAWRYRRIWGHSEDPNVGIREAGVDPQIVSLDLFGIMIAIDSGGRCDDLVYAGMTPVNIMRVLFACLAKDRSLLATKAADISLFANVRHGLWITARDGESVPTWEPFDKPD